MENEVVEEVAEEVVEEVVEPQEEILLAGKYKDAAALETAYKALESKLGEKPEADLEKLKAEWKAENDKPTYEKAEEYTYTPSEDLIPDGRNVEFDANDPIMAKWKDLAHKSNLTQDQFNAATDLFIESTLANQPDIAAEHAALGENAQARIDRIDMWAGKHLSEENYAALVQASTSATFVAAMEQIMGLVDTVSLESGDSKASGPLSLSELQSMQRDPRYRNPRERDEGFIQRVNEGFKALTASR